MTPITENIYYLVLIAYPVSVSNASGSHLGRANFSTKMSIVMFNIKSSEADQRTVFAL